MSMVPILTYSIFSSKFVSCDLQIRLSKDDLEKERGAVMEEYRDNRNANGRILDAYWTLMMEGSKVKLWSLNPIFSFMNIIYFN